MNRRLVVISLGIFLLLVDLTLVALVVHPTSETEHRPAERAFSVGETGEYEVVAAITVDGEPVVTVEGVVTDSGDRYRRVRQEGVTSEVYRNGSGDGIEYGRTVVEREKAERRLRQLREDPERSVRSERWENGTLSVVTRTEDPTSRRPVGSGVSRDVPVATGGLRPIRFGE